MKTNLYTNGIDIISIIKKERSGYLIKDTNEHTFILNNLKGYRRLGDKRTIKDWYKDSIRFTRKHPITAFVAGLSVFFGLTSY